MVTERNGPGGDLAAMYRAEADFVWRTLLRKGVPAQAAEDVAHEVFLVAARRFGDFDPARGSPRAWLYGIACWVASSDRRARARADRKLARVPPREPGAGPEEVVAEAQAIACIDEFLRTLESRQREVFALVDIEGLRGPEVADALAQPLSAVYSWLRLARRHFVAFADEQQVRAHQGAHPRSSRGGSP